MLNIRKSLNQKLIVVIAAVLIVFFLVVGLFTKDLFVNQVISNMEEYARIMTIDEGAFLDKYFESREQIGINSAENILRMLKNEYEEHPFNFAESLKTINGALRTDTSAYESQDISAVFVSSLTGLTRRTKQYIVSTERHFDMHAKALSNIFFNTYLITADQMIRIYEKNWALEVEAEHDFTKDIFYYIADPEHAPDRKAKWTPPYYDDIWERWMTSLIVPLYDGDEFIGIVGHDLILTDIYSSLLSKKYFTSGYNFVFNEEKKIILHPKYLDKLSDKAQMGQLMDISSSSDKKLNDIITEIVDKTSSGKFIYRQIDAGEQEFFIYAYKLDFLDWYFAIALSKEDVLSSLPWLQKIFFSGALISFGILFGILSLLLWWNVIKPIREITAITEEVMDGNLDSKTAVNTEDEIGRLGMSLNMMTGNMQDMLIKLREDIKLRRTVENELIRLTSILESTSDLVSVSLPNSKLTFINNAGRKILGWRKFEDIKEKKISDLHPQWAYRLITEIGIPAAVKNGNWKGETSLLTIDGTEIPVSQVIIVHKNHNGDVEYISTIMRDISDIKAAQNAIAENREKYKSLFENSKEALIVSDLRTMKISDVNKAAEELYSYSKSEFKELSLYDINSDGLIRKELPTSAAAHSVINIETAEVTKNGVVFPAEVTLSFFETNNIHYVIQQVKDLSLKKHTEQKLSNIAKLESLGILAGGIAHNFKNILASVELNIGFLKINPEKNSRYISKIEKSLEQASALATRFQTFTKGGEPLKETVQISHILEESVSIAFSGTNHDCVLSIPEDLAAVDVDVKQMNEVFMNLMLNAQQAMPDGGTVRINADNISVSDDAKISSGDYVRITVVDTGRGIPVSIIDNIFDPFFTTKEGGHGLGLSSAHFIIQKHGGYISVISQENFGASFEVYLPVSRSNIALHDEISSEILYGNHERILFMDDDDEIRANMYELGELLEYEMKCVATGELMLAEYQKAMDSANTYDMVILDLTIKKGMGGEQAIKHLLEIDPHAKAIVFSGHSNKPIVANFRDYGFVGRLDKPASINVLSKVLYEVKNS